MFAQLGGFHCLIDFRKIFVDVNFFSILKGFFKKNLQFEK